MFRMNSGMAVVVGLTLAVASVAFGGEQRSRLPQGRQHGETRISRPTMGGQRRGEVRHSSERRSQRVVRQNTTTVNVNFNGRGRDRSDHHFGGGHHGGGYCRPYGPRYYGYRHHGYYEPMGFGVYAPAPTYYVPTTFAVPVAQTVVVERQVLERQVVMPPAQVEVLEQTAPVVPPLPDYWVGQYLGPDSRGKSKYEIDLPGGVEIEVKGGYVVEIDD